MIVMTDISEIVIDIVNVNMIMIVNVIDDIQEVEVEVQ
jgi:hypothetical protein